MTHLFANLILLLNIILGDSPASGFQECSGDYTDDFNLDILDIVGIIIAILGD